MDGWRVGASSCGEVSAVVFYGGVSCSYGDDTAELRFQSSGSPPPN